jgi:hypothetical protein
MLKRRKERRKREKREKKIERKKEERKYERQREKKKFSTKMLENGNKKWKGDYKKKKIKERQRKKIH